MISQSLGNFKCTPNSEPEADIGSVAIIRS